MLYIAENLRSLRKGKDLTQEEAAEILGVSPQSVSKWERGETLPDITLLPVLANLFKVSIDELVGMDKINDKQTKNNIFDNGYKYLRSNDITAAVNLFTEAQKMFPNDEDIMSYLAMSLALSDDPDNLSKALSMCERLLSDNQGDKVHHTTRAALCFIYLKAGEKDKAFATARKLPHIRESREVILEYFERVPSVEDIDTYLKFIAVGEIDEQDVIEIDFGINLVTLCTEHGLLDRIADLREELSATLTTRERHKVLPPIRIRDKAELAPNMLRVRYYADYLIDGEYTDMTLALNDIIQALRKMAKIDKS